MKIKSKFPKIQENILLTNHTTFRIGGPAKYFCVAQNKDELVDAVRRAKEKNLPIFIIGGGSNLLVGDEGFDGVVIKTQNSKLKTLRQRRIRLGRKNDNSKLKISCEVGVPFISVIMEAVKKGYSGAEWGLGIPGTIGGAICGNAGRLGQDISPIVEKVVILDKNLREKILSREECEFSYRESRFKKTGEIILEATLSFSKKPQEKIEEVLNQAKEVMAHSPKFPSAGCIFKNYTVGSDDNLLREHPELVERVRGACLPARQGKIGVGLLIDWCGLRGKKIGGAQIWEGHANYIVNIGGAKAHDVLELIKICKQAVKEKYNFDLVEEIRYVGLGK